MRFFISLFISLALVLPSCTQKLTPISHGRGDGSRSQSDGSGASTNTGPVTSGDEDGKPEGAPSAIYVCGVEYPDTDTSQIILLRDSVLMLALPQDIPNGIGLDPDTHFLFSDSLYTTTSYRGKTIIALSGKPIISYDGREYITDLIPSDRGLWTLGNDRSGEGFTLRLDGKPVFSSGSGRARSLHLDGDKAYCIYLTSAGAEQMLSLVQEGTANGLGTRYGTRVLDARVRGGELWLLEQGENGWVVSTSQERFDYSPRPPFQFSSGQLFDRPYGRCAGVIFLVAPGQEIPAELICSEGEEILTGSGGGNCYHYFEAQQLYLLRYDKSLSRLSVGIANTVTARLDSTIISNRRAACAWGSDIYVACYPAAGGEAIIWNNGITWGLGFDGYPTGISLSPPK